MIENKETKNKFAKILVPSLQISQNLAFFTTVVTENSRKLRVFKALNKIIHVGFNTDICAKLPDAPGAQQRLA